MSYYQRFLGDKIIEELGTMPAVFLNGPRQTGKTTLVKEIARKIKAGYITFDELSTLSAALTNPEGFVNNLAPPVILDEIQRAPDLFFALKRRIDETRAANKKAKHKANGQFILTGSANVLALPRLADALVGRMSVLTLFPLSTTEIARKEIEFLPALWSKKNQYELQPSRFTLGKMMSMSTYPQLASDAKINREQWFSSYLSTLLQRDIRALAEIEKVTALPNMLKVMATRVGGLTNDAALARDAGLNMMTYRRYRELLQALFLTITVPPWYKNFGKRLVKAAKNYFIDTALLCYLLGMDMQMLRKINPNLYGKVLENFVATELLKQLSQENIGQLYHFRTQDGKEVDFLIEKQNGDLLGIEVKARQTIYPEDFACLKILQASFGKAFKKGVVLYGGERILPFGKELFALPISSLWRLNELST